MIALGYDKQELRERIEDVRIHNGISGPDIKGLLFAVRIVNDEEDHHDPLVYLTVDDGSNYQAFRMNGPVNGDSRVPNNFEFNINFYHQISPRNQPSYWELGAGPSGPTFFEFSHEEGTGNMYDRYQNFGFTFFHMDHVNTFLDIFPNNDLILSGAMVDFGTGRNVHNPRESFSFKIEISNTSQGAPQGMTESGGRSAAALEDTTIGTPLSVIGPPCPPYWIPDLNLI